MASTGKKYSKTVKNPKTGRKKTVRYGAQGYTIAPGTSRGDSYCARSAGQMKEASQGRQRSQLTPASLPEEVEMQRV